MESYSYANAASLIMQVMINTKSDLAYPISVLSKYTRFAHWLVIKWVVSYIVCSLNVGLCYSRTRALLDLVGYVDAAFAGDPDTKKLTTSYIFTLAVNCIQWKSGLQSMLTLSTIESEYIGITSCMGTVFTDSQSMLYLIENHTYHERSKHIGVKVHYV